MLGIKYWILDLVDSESEGILTIGPSRGRIERGLEGGRKWQGKNELNYFDLYLSVGYQILGFG